MHLFSGGSRISRWGGAPTLWGGGGGRQPPTHTLFGKNVCETKEIDPVGMGGGGGGARAVAAPLDLPMLILRDYFYSFVTAHHCNKGLQLQFKCSSS